MSANNLLLKIKIGNTKFSLEKILNFIDSIFNKEAILYILLYIYNNYSFDIFM